MKILVMTDMEGVAGILSREEWVLPGGCFYEKGKRLLTEEVNAAADGLIEGGASEILVVDGHGPGGIDPEILHESANLMRGRSETTWPWSLDASFDGVAFVGQHAKAGTPYSHLTHTQSMRYADLSVNGMSIGEYGQIALCAMELGVPTILACGEKALAEEAEALTPGVVAVAVKRGLLPDGLDHLDMEAYAKAKLSAVHVSPKRARKLIRDGALRAMEKLRASPESFKYPKLTPPYVRIVRLRKTGGIPAYETRDENPDSIIGLLNMPIRPPDNASPVRNQS